VPAVAITAPAPGSAAAAGQTITFRATATDSDDGDLSPTVRWSSSLSGPLGTGATIAVATLARGAHAIRAEATDADGLTGVATIAITVGPSSANQPPAIAITAPPAGTTVEAGTAVTFAAAAADDFAGDVSAAIAWTSSIDGLLGTGSTVTTAALSPGIHTITAAVGDGVGQFAAAAVGVTVLPPSLAFDAIADAWTEDGANAAVSFGADPVLQADANPLRRIFFRFIAWGLNGRPIQRAVVRLQTASTSDAGSDRAGRLRVVDDNTWTETGITHQNAPALGTVVASVDAVEPSETVDFDVTSVVTTDGVYHFGLDSTSSNLVKYHAREAAVGRPQLVLFLRPPAASGPVVDVTAPANLATLPAGIPTTLRATAQDAEDGDVAGTLTWTSSRDGVLGTGTPLAPTLSPGTHTIIATAADGAGNRGSDAIQVSVSTSAPTVGIVSPAPGASLRFGEPVPFIGAAIDPQDGDLSFAIAWSSSADGPLGTGPSLAHLLSPGPHTVTARVTDAAGNASAATVDVVVTTADVGFTDFAYPSGATAGSDEITSQKPESKLWHHDGVWWGTLYSDDAGAYRIHRLDLPTQQWVDTGVTVDPRMRSRQDVLWDGQKLYMVSRFQPAPSECRLYRFAYHAGAQVWSLDPGFPVDVPGGATEALTVAKDSTGRLWIAFTLNDRVWVAHTQGSDAQWSAPFVLPVPEGTTVNFDDVAAVVALPGKIGVFWSNQATDRDYFAVHADGAPPGAWTLEVPAAGGNVADDHFNLKVASDGRLFVAMKTSRTAPGATLIGLLVRAPSGAWSPVHPVVTTDFNPTRAQLLLDEVQRRAYLFYSPQHATIHYKTTDLDAIAFPGGVGTAFIAKPGVADVNDPTTTKQNVDPATGLVVLASDFASGRRYHHNAIAPQPRPAVAITAPADGARRATGSTVAFAGTATAGSGTSLTPSLRWVSDRDGQIGTGGAFTRANLSAGTHAITASVTDATGLVASASVALTVEPDAPPAVAITAPAAGRKFLRGEPAAFAATALDSLDGDRAAALAWTSDRDGAIGTGGAFTTATLGLGAHTVTAQAADTAGLVGTATVGLEVQDPAPPSVTLTAPLGGTTFALAAPVRFAAAATDLFDGDLTARLRWTSSRDGAIGAGGGFDRATLSEGVHEITATVTDGHGLAASARTTITVAAEAPPVVAIQAPADGAVLGDARPIVLRATAVDAIDGDVGASLRWTSDRAGPVGSGPDVATTALGPGTHVVTAAATDRGGRTGTAAVTIEVRHQTPPSVAIAAPADGTAVAFTTPLAFTGGATDVVDGDLSAGIRWTSDRDGLLGTGPSVTTTLSVGPHVVTATATNAAGQTGSAGVAVTVFAAPFVSVAAPADGTLVVFGTPIACDGTAFDFEDGDLTTAIVWTSSRDGVLGTGPGVTAILSRGVHEIVGTATDADGHAGAAAVSVTVDAAPAVSIAAPAEGAVFAPGESIAFAGGATDAEQGSLTASLRWTSSLDGPLGQGGSFAHAGLSAGRHTITAAVTDAAGIEGRAERTIDVVAP